jgi:hypothetical protein
MGVSFRADTLNERVDGIQEGIGKVERPERGSPQADEACWTLQGFGSTVVREDFEFIFKPGSRFRTDRGFAVRLRQ